MKMSKAFTLIELMFSIVILSVLAVYTWLSIDTSFKTQQSVERFADLYQSASAVMGKVTLDLEQMFLIPSYQNLTYLQGDERQVAFTSLNHAIVTEDAKESEQTEITYKTESNPDRRNSLLLMRDETRFIDGPKEETEEKNFEILSGRVKSFELEYSKDGVDYVSAWDTTKVEHKDQLPKIIKLNIVFTQGEQSNAEEVAFETFIDIPMSDFQNAATQGNSNNGDNPDNDSDDNQPPPTNNPFGGISGGVNE